MLAIKDLRYLQVMWSGSGADEAELLANASLNSCLEKGGYSIKSTWESLLRKAVLMDLFLQSYMTNEKHAIVLKECYRADFHMK